MLKSFYIRFCGVFITLFTLTILPGFISIGIVKNILLFFLNPLLRIIDAKNIESDSKEMYHVVILYLILSIFAASIWGIISGARKNEGSLYYWTQVISAYILSFFLFVYGFNKVFKLQFYIPEPNTLYTPLGQLSKDILFWSSMGSSHSYNLFMGLVEIIPALLLLFRRTRMLGAVISFTVLLNVLMINFGFDISVKILSSFLLFLSLVILAPYAKKLFSFFFQVNNKVPRSTLSFEVEKTKKLIIFKSCIICCILFETLFTYFNTNNFNDNMQNRPLFHGAYQVLNAPNSTSQFGNLQQIKRIFIHRKGFFIIQFQDDKMKDFQMKTNTLTNTIDVYTVNKKMTLKITPTEIIWNEKSTPVHLPIKKLNWGKLPLLRDEFHWISEF
jgi:hypothetical protein